MRPTLIAYALVVTMGHRDPYPTMRPLDEYLMPRDSEIALARSAAPEVISRDATILVLGRAGFETAVHGTNGFVCMVERGWVGAFDWPEFWNPKVRGADCFNPEAARSIVPLYERKTAMFLAGGSKDQVIAALAAEKLPALEAGAMSYMMSRSAYLTDAGDHNGPHLMFFTSIPRARDWSARAVSIWFMSGQPASVHLPPITVYAIPVTIWSDGSPAEH